jgi:hypothetical protein
MNTKELAKLLLKHPLIKKINESQLWDRSIVSRVIAEELMVEQDEMVKKLKSADLTNASSGELEKLKKELESYLLNLSLGGGPETSQEEKDLKYLDSIGDRMPDLIARAKKREEQQNAAPAQKESEKEAPERAPSEKPEPKPKEVSTQDEKELERAELKGLIQTLQGDIDFYIKQFGEESVPEDVRERLADAKKDLEAIDKASEAITDKAAESDNPKIEKAAKLVNRDTAEKVAQVDKEVEAVKNEPPEVKAVELAKAIEEIPTEKLKAATEKIVKSEPQPEPQPEPISEPIPYQIKWKSLGDSYARKAKAKLSDVRYAYLKQLIDIYEKKDIDSWKQRHPKIAEKTTDDQIVEFLEQNADKLAKKYADFFKEYEAALESKNKEAVEKVEDEIEQQEEQEETTAFQLVTPEDQVDEKAEKYREIGEELLKAEQFQGLKLAQNPLFQIYAAFWLSKETGQEMRVDELNLKGIPNNRIEEFTNENLLSIEQQKEFLSTIKNEMDSFKNLLGALKKFSGSIDDDEEEKEKLLPQVIKAADEEVPPVPDLQKLSQVKFQDFLIGLLSKGLPLKADDEIIDITPEDELEPETTDSADSPTPVQDSISEDELEDELKEDIAEENQTPARVYNEQQYETLATFFADKGGKGLGFMQQLLLRRQSEQLQNLIKTLDGIIDPDKDQMKALARAPVNEQQEDTQEKTIELEPSQKRKLKSELLGLLSALKNLRTLSKAYEENMTRTSVDPRYDGSSLKARLDEMLPEIQGAIARILKMIQDFFGDLQKVGAKPMTEQTEGGRDREAKIDLVEKTYSDMRKIWTAMAPALEDTFKKEEPQPEPSKEEVPPAEPKAESLLREKDASKATEAVIKNATDMKSLATADPFITFFPTIVFANGGEVVSIEQANKVLSGVISEFVYVMRNVVALAKGEQITEGDVIVVKQKLSDIANAIEENFGIPTAKIVKQIEKEAAGDPKNQSLTDTPANNNAFFDDTAPTGEPEGDLELDDEDEEPDTPISSDDVPKSLQSLVEPDILTAMETLQEKKDKQSLEFYFGFLMDLIDKKPQPEEMMKEFVNRILVARRVKTALKNNNIDYPSLQVSEAKGLMRAEEILKGLLEDEKFRIDKHLDSFLSDLTEDNEEEVKNILSKILKKVESEEEPIGEALKPIIAKMLKEHHG